MHAQFFRCVLLFVTLWTVACQTPLSNEFSRQEYLSGLPFPTPGDFLDPGIEPASSALAGGFFTIASPGKPMCLKVCHLISKYLGDFLDFLLQLISNLVSLVYWRHSTRFQLFECVEIYFQFNSVQSLSRVWLCDPMNHSAPGLPVHHQLLESTQTHVHWVGDAIQPSHPLSSPSPPAFNLSQHQVYSLANVWSWVIFYLYLERMYILHLFGVEWSVNIN